MKTKLLLIAGVCLVVAQVSSAQGTARTWGFGIRQHAEQPDFPGMSFGDELSYGLSLTAADKSGYWQAGILYTPEIESIPDADYAITPEVNLVLAENSWRMGIGGARTYVSSDTDSGWRDFFWQAILGFGLPGFGMGTLEARAIYVFDGFDNIGDFDTSNLEYAIWMGIPF
jgi:hypothetical protein